MGRYSNCPTTVEDRLTFRLKSLTENNNTYLTSYGTRSGVTRWSRNGEEYAKINIEVTHNENQTYIIFDYKCNGEPKRYKINLVSKVSNLGKGYIWFFICPSTGKQCRKLYLESGYFLHRSALQSGMYASQIKSKKTREFDNLFGSCYDTEKYHVELYSKHFKTHYNGRLTKRYLKLQQKIDEAENKTISEHDFIKHFLR